MTATALKWEALALAVLMAIVVGTALAFQHLGGYIPCALCLEQRTPYYLGIPVLLAAFVAASLNAPPLLVRALIAVGGLLMAWSLVLAVRHAGVEWDFWAGPTDCGVVAPVDTGGAGVLDAIDTMLPPSCDEAAGRFLGLSFAGWNAVASLVLMLAAFASAARRR
jgi:disulfide bond formation protein DsbB